MGACWFVGRAVIQRLDPCRQKLDTRPIWVGLTIVVILLASANLVTGLATTGNVVIAAAIGLSIACIAKASRHDSHLLKRSARQVRFPQWFTLLIACGFAGFTMMTVAAVAIPVENYDTWLYHSASIQYIRDYPIVIGLANIHDRFGTQSGTFLLSGTNPIVPWAFPTYLTINGFLLFALGLDCTIRLLRFARTRSFASEDMIMLVGSAYLVASITANSSGFVSSPSPDTGAAISTLVAIVFLARFLRTRRLIDYSLATVVAMLSMYFRLSNIILLCIVTLALVVVTRQNWSISALKRSSLFILSFSIVGTALLLMRAVLLTGYPLYPALFGFPLSWTVPRETVANYSLWVSSWARQPGLSPDIVLSSNAWFIPWWDVFKGSVPTRMAELLIALGLVAYLAFGFRVRPYSYLRSVDLVRTSIAIAAPATLVVAWFHFAPDVRFAWGSIGSLAAVMFTLFATRAHWGEAQGRGSQWRLVCAVSASIAIIFLAANVLHFPPFGGPRLNPAGQVHAAPSPPTFQHIYWTTLDGVRFTKTTAGDQCGAVVWCTPYPNDKLTLTKVGIWYVAEVTARGSSS